MLYIVLGIFGFMIIHFFHVVSLKGIPCGAKPCLWALGSGLLGYSIMRLCLESKTLPLTTWATWLGWGLLSISLSLLMFSLFVNLPFRNTYIATIVGKKPITTGLYALVRHPWVHCFTLVLVSLILISKSRLLLVAAPIFIVLDIVSAIIQDKFFLVRMFDGYDKYQQQTPMLLPNKKSLSAFMKGMWQPGIK